MKLARIAKTYFSTVVFALVALIAFLHARAVTQIMGFRVAHTEVDLAKAPVLAPRALTSPVPRGDTILARNAFDSVTGPIHEPTTTSMEVALAEEDASIDPMDAPQCEGLKVIAIAASTDPDWSLVSFTPTSGGETKPLLRRRGGDLAGKTVRFIAWDRVWLSSGTKLCQLGMWRPPAPAIAPSAASTPAQASNGKGDALLHEIATNIQRRGLTDFKISRSVVEKVLENTAALMGQVQLAPGKDGATGLRISGVKPDSVLGLLGLSNGDRLQAINGFDLTNPEKALEAYARLGTASHLTLAVVRNGATTNLDYDIE